MTTETQPVQGSNPQQVPASTSMSTSTSTANTSQAPPPPSEALPVPGPVPLLPAPSSLKEGRGDDGATGGAEGSSTGPDRDNGTTVVEVNGSAVVLDRLGPVVVGRDGSVSRIANWLDMTEGERTNTLRVLGKRNQLRVATLRGTSNSNSNDQK